MMGPLLAVLPLIVFAVLFLLVLGRTADQQSGSTPDWRAAFLAGSLLWGACVVLISEFLGFFELISRPWVAAAWAGVGIGGVWLGVRKGTLVKGWQRLASVRLPSEWFGRTVLAGLILIAASTLTVAFISPPNNVDSLLYHMSRVAHWTQNGSLRHYATGYHNQLMMPPWAETAILNLRVLWGSDRPANLVQWFSMLGSVVAASAIAESLGARSRGQWLASAFVASIPMGILQSTSSQNDYVVAFWAMCLAAAILRPVDGGDWGPWVLSVGSAAGLALLTKATAYVYTLPFGLWFVLTLFIRYAVGRAATGCLAALAVIIALNSGYWLRNLDTYGGPFGPPDWVSDRLVPNIDPDLSGRGSEGDDARGTTPGLASRVATMAARNLVTPSLGLNESLWSLSEIFPSLIGPDFGPEMRTAAWNHEDTAGNPLHLAAVVASVLVLPGLGIWVKPKLPGSLARYLVSTLAGFVLIALLISGATDLYSLRFQLPFIVLSAPLVGLALERLGWPPLTWISAGGLLLFSLPWLLLNNTRPMIDRRPWPTRVDSIFRAPAAEVMFAAVPQLMDPLREVAALANEAGCRAVGLRIDSSHPEYLFWWSLAAPESGIRVESVYTYEVLERYLDAAFVPCAVICTICGGRTELDGLRLQADLGLVRYFAAPRAGALP